MVQGRTEEYLELMEEIHIMKLLTAFISKLMYACALVVLLAVGAFFALPHVPGFGALDVKIVKSGSMEPNINTGGVVVIHETGAYTVGDVVTFESVTADIPTTHRIIGTEVGPDGNTYFVTKGDANEDRDADLVAPESIIGKVVGDAPYVGFLLDFARQPVGFALLIGLPALLIIIDEVEKIWKALRARRRTEDEDSSSDDQSSRSSKDALPRAAHMPLVVPPLPSPRRVMMHDIMPRGVRMTRPLKEEFAFESYAKRSSRLVTGAFSVLLMGVTLFSSTYFVGGTVSYARDVEASLGNLFGTTVADFTLDADTTNFSVVGGFLTDPDIVFTIAKTGESEELAYRPYMRAIDGDQTFCEALQATADVPFPYSGQIQQLGSEDVSNTPGVAFTAPWTVALEMEAGTAYIAGTYCVIQVSVVGWLSDKSELTSKYVDDEFLTLTFTVEEALPFALEGEALTIEGLSVFLTGGDAGTEPLGEEEETPLDETEGGGGGSTPTEEQTEEVIPEEVSDAPTTEEVSTEDAPIVEETPVEEEEASLEEAEPEADTSEDVTEEPAPETVSDPVA